MGRIGDTDRCSHAPSVSLSQANIVQDAIVTLAAQVNSAAGVGNCPFDCSGPSVRAEGRADDICDGAQRSI